VLENRVLKRIFGLMRGEVIRGWRKLRDEELHNLYRSPSVIRMMKSRRMRCACSEHGRVEECIYDFGGKA
jgi:hypothetical protein